MNQIWPPVVDPGTLTRQVWDSKTARSLPAVGRALGLYGGLISQCALDQYQGDRLGDRPPLLKRPDPNLKARSTFVRVNVEDYLIHGNALHLITARDAAGWPRAVRWFPAGMWGVDASFPTNLDYYLNGQKIARREDVVHVQWGAAEGEPWRGVGIVERHLKTLNRAGLQEAAESNALKHGSVPSVAVIAPQATLSKAEADAAADTMEEKFGGSARRPAVFPNGTQIQPLSFSPLDQQAALARQLSLTDVANILNIDGYWLGAPTSSHTYRSPGPMFLTLQRTSLEPVMTDLESVWSLAWIRPELELRFDRNQLTRDDFASMITTLVAAVKGGLMSPEEARIYLGWSPTPAVGELLSPSMAAEPPQTGDTGLTLLPGGAEDPKEGTGS